MGVDVSAYTYNLVNQVTGGTFKDKTGVTTNLSYTYDANGSLTHKSKDGEVSNFTYDYENRLKTVQRTAGGVTTNVEFKYDPFGRRIRKAWTTDAGANWNIVNYVYDGEDILIEYDGTGAVINKYTHGPGIDEPLATIRNGAVYYYHADERGSIKAVTDGSGTVVSAIQYTAFGRPVKIGSYPGDGTWASGYAYTGREWDNETGLYYYRARYYDANDGRFLSKDPIGFAGGMNLYAYVGGNPVKYTDPWGWSAIMNGPALEGTSEINCLGYALGVGNNVLPNAWYDNMTGPSMQEIVAQYGFTCKKLKKGEKCDCDCSCDDKFMLYLYKYENNTRVVEGKKVTQDAFTDKWIFDPDKNDYHAIKYDAADGKWRYIPEAMSKNSNGSYEDKVQTVDGNDPDKYWVDSKNRENALNNRYCCCRKKGKP